MTILTFVRGIKTFLGIGNPCEEANSWAAKSLVFVNRVPSTKSATQNGRGKSFRRCKPDCNIATFNDQKDKVVFIMHIIK